MRNLVAVIAGFISFKVLVGLQLVYCQDYVKVLKSYRVEVCNIKNGFDNADCKSYLFDNIFFITDESIIEYNPGTGNGNVYKILQKFTEEDKVILKTEDDDGYYWFTFVKGAKGFALFHQPYGGKPDYESVLFIYANIVD